MGNIIDFIAAANAAAIDIGIPTLNITDKEFPKGVEGPPQLVAQRVFEIALTYTTEMLSVMPRAVEPLAGTVLYHPENPWDTIRDYLLAREVRTFFISLARAVKEGAGKPISIPLPKLENVQVAQVGADDHWIMIAPADAWLQHDQFCTALKATDVRRIRECSGCEKIFYAARLDQIFCRSVCRSIRWQKEHPERWAEIQSLHDQKRAPQRSRKRTRTPGTRKKDRAMRTSPRAVRLPGSGKPKGKHR